MGGDLLHLNNISAVAKKNESTGECLIGEYFWATDMILSLIR